MKTSPRVFTVVAIALALGALTFWKTPPMEADSAVEGGSYEVGGKDVTGARVLWDADAAKAAKGAKTDAAKNADYEPLGVETVTREDGTFVSRVRTLRTWGATLTVTLADGTKQVHRLQVFPLWYLGAIALLFLALAVVIPYAFAGQAQGAWYALLSEKGGGYSLSRVQLLIWFLPTAVLYAALALTLRSFVNISAQIALLLGLSGVTAALGTAANPSKATTAATKDAAPVEANLSDMVTDWNNQGDVSRYQYLLLSIIGAVVMVAAFWRRIEFPDLPSQFLLLVAGSQGTYVATKAIKAAKTDTADTAAAAAAAAAAVDASPKDDGPPS